MTIEEIVNNLDITKIKAPSGLTFAQELANAANVLKDCIENRIGYASMEGSVSAANLADVTVSGNSMTVTLKIPGAERPSVFNEFNHKYADVFWLINDGFTVKKDWYFDGFPHKERWISREARRYVEEGIADFKSKTTLPVKIDDVKKPAQYYW